MRRLVLLALLLSFAAGCGGSSRPLASDGLHSDVPAWVAKENLPRAAVPGATLFSVAGCTACHMYLGSGAQVLNAPDLSAVGRRHLGVAYEIAHLKCPSCTHPGSPMPPFAQLGRKRLHQMAIFLEASKGLR